jgi:hypothetical protein
MRRLYLFAAVAISASILVAWAVSRLPPAHARPKPPSENAYAPEGLRFRDGWELRWGQSRRQIAPHLGAAAECRDIARNSLALAHCGIGRDALPRPFIAGDAWFMDGRFFRVFLIFPPDQYDRVAREVSAGFGGPGASFASAIRLYTGARAPQVETNWDAGDVTAVMRLHDGEDGLSSLSMIYDPIANEPPAADAASAGY